MLQSACRTCRPPWHGNLPDTARALSGLVQTDETAFRKLKKSDPLLREQASQHDWPIKKAQHLNSRIMVARSTQKNSAYIKLYTHCVPWTKSQQRILSGLRFKARHLTRPQASGCCDSEDGLHPVDIALLPQAKVPCKVAIEADGEFHFLYESYKLDKGPHAVRPNGSTLFRNAVLEKQGWHVVSVPWFDWDNLHTKADKVAYLETKIRQAVSQHSLGLQHQTC
ncbi:hypothetical protein WJX82_010131 [Trebouxia sp. C0006]